MPKDDQQIDQQLLQARALVCNLCQKNPEVPRADIKLGDIDYVDTNSQDSQ